ncbi:MAG: rhomboid family intramembrane serine protease [Saprospiraceae bacterium]|nr:rhomboid family intramembrane serine protease [Saprospiraceae bacterium]
MNLEKKRIFYAFLYPTIFVLILWIVKYIEISTGKSLSEFGLFPLQAKGLIGIVAMPLLHGDLNHLWANSVPLLILGAGLFYFYKEIALKAFFWIYLLSGMFLWLFARGENAHIGASGLVYGLASFHFVSSVIRRNKSLIAFSLVIVFFYGGLVWGVIPDFFPEKNISWEGHLMGAFAGFIMAINCRKKGPQREKYDWGEDDDEEDEDDEDNNLRIVYHFKDGE